MKSLVFKISGILLLIFLASNGLSQNANWILPKIHYDGLGIYPLPINANYTQNDTLYPYDYYDGAAAQHASNMVNNPDGSIRFFVIDGLIYDTEGKYLDYAWSSTLPSIVPSNYPVNYRLDGNGGNDILIVPNPGNCNQYYIFGMMVYKYSGYVETEPYYALYDHCSKSIIERKVWYSTSGTGGIFNSNTYLATYGDQNMTNTIWGIDLLKNGYRSLSATKKRADGSRYVLAEMSDNIYVIKIHSNGTLTYWKRFLKEVTSGSSMGRYEFEVVEDSISGDYSIAYSGFNAPLNGGSGYTLGVMRFDSTFANQTATPINYMFYDDTANNNIISIRGLEFSPDQSKLYATIKPNAIHPYKLYYINIGATPSLDSLNIGNKPIECSFVEKGVDGNLYFASSNGLYRLSSPNNPNSANFSTNPIISFSYQENYASIDSSYFGVENKAYVLPDQIDGEDYIHFYNDNLSCCKLSNTYDIVNFVSDTNITWTTGVSTPFTSSLPQVITIRDELRVKAGTTLTLSNMTLKFAPGARLVIEQGSMSGQNVGVQGGKLILDKTTLTVDDRCFPGKLMWLGVEVWGISSQKQYINNSTVMGQLIMQNASMIEHAKVGALIGRRQDTITGICENNLEQTVWEDKFDDKANGGIIKTNQSFFRQNEIGTWFRAYFSAGGYNNHSYFRNTNFDWDAELNEGLYAIHLKLQSVRGISVQGCQFNNNIPTPLYGIGKGIGIFSSNAGFYVTWHGSTKSIFKNLNVGIQTTNFLSTVTYNVQNSYFENCLTGIYSTNTNNEYILNNIFASHDAHVNEGYVSVGVYLVNSRKYTIQENTFTSLRNNSISIDSSRVYGLFIQNSGTANNLVYRNIFGTNPFTTTQGTTIYNGGLYTATYAYGNNGSDVPLNYTSQGAPYAKTSGLKYKCNRFYKDVYLREILVKSAQNEVAGIDYNQGTYYNSITPTNISISQARRVAANNWFETIHENQNTFHNIELASATQNIIYTYLDGNLALYPDHSSTGKVFSYLQHYQSSPLNFTTWNDVCPQNYGKPVISLQNNHAVQLQIVDSIDVLDNDAHDDKILKTIYKSQQPDTLTNYLHQFAPLLPDTALVLYLRSGASASNIKNVLIENCYLSPYLIQKVRSSNLPNGAKDQIITANGSVDYRNNLLGLWHQSKTTLDDNYNQINSFYLTDSTVVSVHDSIFQFIVDIENTESRLMQIDLYNEAKNFTKSDSVFSLIASESFYTNDYRDLNTHIQTLQSAPSLQFALDSIVGLDSSLISLLNTSTEQNVIDAIHSIYQFVDTPDVRPNIVFSNQIMIYNNENQENHNAITSQFQYLNIYPNPSTGNVYFDYPQQKDSSLEIELFDFLGRSVYSKTLGAQTNGEMVNLAHLQKGIYLVRVKMNKQIIEVKRLILK